MIREATLRDVPVILEIYRQMAELPGCGWKLGQRQGIVWYETCPRDGEPARPTVSWREL